MKGATQIELPDRGVLAVAGPDARAFLQGLVSNDVLKVGPGRAVYAAFLTPQGKYLHDFFIAAVGEALVLDCEAARRDDLLKRLTVYKLRAKATLEDWTGNFSVAAIPGAGAAAALGLPADPGAAKELAGGAVFVDPRLAALGARAVLPRGTAKAALEAAGIAPGDRGAYESLRLSLGVPDGSRDLVADKSILLENGFDELNGVDWKKGCFVGQELTARTKYRALIKKRLLPVAIEGPVPAPGTIIRLGEDEAGEMRSATDGRGLALLRVETLDKLKTNESLAAGGAKLKPSVPGWVVFQNEAEAR